MKGDTIPDQDHVARLCNPNQAPEGQIQPSAFMLKSEEEYLSVNWLEFLNCSCRESEINELRQLYSRKFSRVGAGARIAVLNVGKICEIVRTERPDNRELKVLHKPELLADDPSLKVDDLSHSGIYNLNEDNHLIAELIVEEVLSESDTYPARIRT
jgi:hypothetical protein